MHNLFIIFLFTENVEEPGDVRYYSSSDVSPEDYLDQEVATESLMVPPSVPFHHMNGIVTVPPPMIPPHGHLMYSPSGLFYLFFI